MKKLTKTIVCVLLVLTSIFCAFGCGEALSAYDIAVKNGFSGTEAEWLESLKGDAGERGKDGVDGTNAAITAKDIYDEAVARGYSGTYLEFVEEYLGGNTSADYTAVINENLNAVVSVESTFTVYSQYQYYNKTQETSARGAGVFYEVDLEKGDAYVITNYHVVYDADSIYSDKIADKIKVYLYGMEDTYSYPTGLTTAKYDYAVEAEYIGGSMQYDIALLRISDSNILKRSSARAAKLCEDIDITTGSTAIAIGNPGGGGIAASLGVVSKDTEFITMTAADDKTSVTFRCMRVDCAINPGNSGGGLFNGKGELIGIVNAKVVEDSMENIGYALPVATVSGVVKNILWQHSLVEEGTRVFPKKAYMGISLSISDSASVYDPLTKTNKITETVVISDVTSDAAKKVFVVGDRIKTLTVGGKTYTITRRYQMLDAMLNARPGETVEITVVRDNAEIPIQMALTDDNFSEME